ncbi:hypothetical protein FOZ62_002318 [Perkinsus olseni]|uniref:Reverse transcriptase domain-containing protein n=1 Tax=Perkinsus olseni TaxID=32597 RepID=A0A7J6RVY7_PEROL|nr:hypothetical protein FOZ62_002318 [Perkinsus olseni]
MYLARVRPIHEGEIKDENQQELVYEVLVPESSSSGAAGSRRQFDYSNGLYQRLPPEAKKQFDREISNYLEAGFWKSRKPAWASVLGPPCVTFPVTQGDHKSTKCRPCTDARCLNLAFPSASYNGPSVMEIIGMVRARAQPGQRMIFMDLTKAFLRLRHAGSKMVEILCKGATYFSDRVLFGLKYGPSALAGLVYLHHRA